ncbi:MAG TPA: hypothetical protein VMW16_04685 [Sedimentisphaerales bacterium]|nr:hypothetical protein [Sedimentisphaerales bacterium]
MKAVLFLTVALVILAANVRATEADTKYLEVIRISEIHELQIPAVEPRRISCMDWSDSDRIAFNIADDPTAYGLSDIYVVDADGGNLKKLTHGDRKCYRPRWIWGDKIAYMEDRTLSIMDTEGNDLRDLLAAEVRNSCTNPCLLSDKYGLIQDRGDEMVLFSRQDRERRVSVPDNDTRWLRARAGLVSDEGNFLLSQARPQYKMLLQRIDLKDGRVRDLALYADPSAYWDWNFVCSRDGTTIIYITGFEIWAMSALGTNSHCIYPRTDTSPQYSSLALSPKGDKLIFLKRELKGDRKWRIWVATLEKDVRPATIYDKVEEIIISDKGASHAISSDEILSLEKGADKRISVKQVNFDRDGDEELLAVIKRGEERAIIVLDYQNKRYVPIWTTRCFYSTEVQILNINDCDNINAIALHTDDSHHGIRDNCRMYKFSSGSAEQIWHQVLTNIYNTGYTGELKYGKGGGWKDLIATITIYYYRSNKGEGPVKAVDNTEIVYKWDGKQYIRDEIEQRVARIMQKLKTQ